MNLFELNYCPICNNELDSDDECENIEHFYGRDLIVLYKNKFDITLNRKGLYRIYYINSYSKSILCDNLEIEVTLENKEEIFKFLYNKLDITIKNLLFL
jgi:hypothetical protein